MSRLSINDILTKIDARLDDLRLTDDTVPIVSLDPLSEVGLYITADRLLADLYRQYLEAQRHYITSIDTHGQDAPMTEIASDMADSAFCAMETRLIELKEEKETTEKVHRLQIEQREKYIEEMKTRQAEHARRGIEQPQVVASTAKTNQASLETSSNNMFWALLAMSFLQNEQQSELNYNNIPAAMEFTRVAA